MKWVIASQIYKKSPFIYIYPSILLFYIHDLFPYPSTSTLSITSLYMFIYYVDRSSNWTSLLFLCKNIFFLKTCFYTEKKNESMQRSLRSCLMVDSKFWFTISQKKIQILMDHIILKFFLLFLLLPVTYPSLH